MVHKSKKPKVSLKKDQVNSPEHYMSGGIETSEFIKAKLTKEEWVGHCKACILKYISRESKKGGVTDLKKAEWYLKSAIETMEK